MLYFGGLPAICPCEFLWAVRKEYVCASRKCVESKQIINVGFCSDQMWMPLLYYVLMVLVCLGYFIMHNCFKGNESFLTLFKYTQLNEKQFELDQFKEACFYQIYCFKPNYK